MTASRHSRPACRSAIVRNCCSVCPVPAGMTGQPSASAALSTIAPGRGQMVGEGVVHEIAGAKTGGK